MVTAIIMTITHCHQHRRVVTCLSNHAFLTAVYTVLKASQTNSSAGYADAGHWSDVILHQGSLMVRPEEINAKTVVQHPGYRQTNPEETKAWMRVNSCVQWPGTNFCMLPRQFSANKRNSTHSRARKWCTRAIHQVEFCPSLDAHQLATETCCAYVSTCFHD